MAKARFGVLRVDEGPLDALVAQEGASEGNVRGSRLEAHGKTPWRAG
jgi:hypothetical protein